MDKSWIFDNSHAREKYIRGVVNFLDFAFEKSSLDGKILFGNLLSVLQTQFSENPQISGILQAVAKEVPEFASASNDSTVLSFLVLEPITTSSTSCLGVLVYFFMIHI